MSQIAPEITEIETAAVGAGIDLHDVLAHAKVSPVTWWRWKSSRTQPRLATIQSLRSALAVLKGAA